MLVEGSLQCLKNCEVPIPHYASSAMDDSLSSILREDPCPANSAHHCIVKYTAYRST